MTITNEEAQQFVGGGNRDLSDGEKDRFAQQVAEANNSYERWAETRPLDERIATQVVTTRSEDGEESTQEVPRVAQTATTVPEGFGGSDSDPEEDEV